MKLIARFLLLSGLLTTIQCSGSSTPTTPSTPTPSPAAALANLSVADTTVTEGNGSTGTVTLTSAAPTGGATIALSADSAIVVPSTIVVAAGATNATFSFSTKAGTGATSGTITAAYAGATKSATVTIAKPPSAVARFGVSGPNESETCEMANGGTTLMCTFNATTSSAPGTIVSYEWTYASAASFSQTTTGPVLTNPTVDCSLLPPASTTGTANIPLTVTLRIRDDRGNVSDARDAGARVLPMHLCGY